VEAMELASEPRCGKLSHGYGGAGGNEATIRFDSIRYFPDR